MRLKRFIKSEMPFELNVYPHFPPIRTSSDVKTDGRGAAAAAAAAYAGTALIQSPGAY